MKKRCLHCSKEFEPNRSDAKYCSSSCKTKAHFKRKYSGGVSKGLGGFEDVAPGPAPLPMSTGSLGPQADFIIDSLKKECVRWEDRYKEERQARKSVTEKAEALKQELTDLKTNQRIEAVENSKPKGLNGFLQENGDMIKEITPHVVPLLQGIAMKIMEGGKKGFTEVETVEENEMVSSFVQWFPTLPEDMQKDFFSILQVLARSDEEKAKSLIYQFKNLLNHGSTVINQTGTY